MNIFCCAKPLWLSGSWLCTLQKGCINYIEAEINREITIYLDYQPPNVISLLKHFSMTEKDCRVWSSPEGETVLSAKSNVWERFLLYLKPYRWSLKQLCADLEIVFFNIEHKRLIRPQILREVPEDLPVFRRFGNMIETMSHYPFCREPIALWYNQFTDLTEATAYVVALQSKGYEIILHVYDDEEYHIAKQTNSDYILYC